MNTQKMIDELDRISQVLNGIVGRLSAASFRDTAVKEAHEIAITLGFEIDNLINELMEMEGDAE